MSSFKPIDGSKEDFRKYLDRKGVLDAITKVLIKCNSDRPENAIEFLLENLGEKLKDKHSIACLENELSDAKNEIETLKRRIESLQVASAAAAPNAGASNGLSPTGDVSSDNVVSESTDKEVNVSAEAVPSTPNQSQTPAGGESTANGETSAPEAAEPVPKDQGAQ